MKQAAKKTSATASSGIAHLGLRREETKLARALLGPPHSAQAEPRVVASNGVPALFDRLRALSAERPGGSIVLAPASPRTAIMSTAGALTRDAERARFRTLVLSCAPDPRGLVLEISESEQERQHAAYRELPEHFSPGLPWHPTATDGAGAVSAAVAEARRAYDLVMIVGPALADCPDAAHLARACDGLVIVAQAQTTTKEELRTAADNARMAGCQVLGIIFAEPVHWLSNLLRKL
jgi:hypothetical protein